MNDANFEAILEKIRPHGRIVSYRANDIIVYQGQLAEKIAFILDGTAKAVACSESGEETWLARFSPGDFFGHMSCLTQHPIDYEVTAESNIQLLQISDKALTSLLGRDIELNQILLRDTAAHLQTMINRLVEALTLTARGRICAELLRLSVPIGITPEHYIIRPNPVLVDMARRVNSTRETVSRTVSQLQKKGVLRRQPGAIVIENPEALKASIK